MLVLDANVVLPACGATNGFERFGDHELVAPPLMWSEARSALREAAWRGEVPGQVAGQLLERLEDGPVEARPHRRLGREAWRLASELGWAKTYDAEYVALAILLGCRLVTLDGRLRHRTGHLGVVIGPDEL